MTFVGGGGGKASPTLIIVASGTAGALFIILIITLLGLLYRRRRRKRSSENNNKQMTYNPRFGVASSPTFQSKADSPYSTYIPYSEQGTLPAEASIPDALYAINESGYAYYLPGYPLKYTSLRQHNKRKSADEPEYAVPIPKHGRNRFYDTPADDDSNGDHVNGRRRELPSHPSTESYAYPDLGKPGNGWLPPGPYYYKVSPSEYDVGTSTGTRVRTHPAGSHDTQPVSHDRITGPHAPLTRQKGVSSDRSKEPIHMLGSSMEYQDFEVEFGRPMNMSDQEPVRVSGDSMQYPLSIEQEFGKPTTIQSSPIHMLGESNEYQDFEEQFGSPTISQSKEPVHMLGESNEYQDFEEQFGGPTIDQSKESIHMLGDSEEYQDIEEEFGTGTIHTLGDSADYQEVPNEMVGSMLDSAEYHDLEDEFGTQYLLPRQFLQPVGSLLDRDGVTVKATLDKDIANYSEDDESGYVEPEPSF